jgi:hypothetical protein
VGFADSVAIGKGYGGALSGAYRGVCRWPVARQTECYAQGWADLEAVEKRGFLLSCVTAKVENRR